MSFPDPEKTDADMVHGGFTQVLWFEEHVCSNDISVLRGGRSNPAEHLTTPKAVKDGVREVESP